MRIAIVALIALTACGQAQQGQEPPLAWSSLKDGSHVAIGATDANTSDAKEVVRCWKGSSGFDCLSVTGDEWRTVRRTTSASLPSSIAPPNNPPGYDCSVGSVGDGFQEHVYGAHGRLASNVVARILGPLESGWSRDYVARYFEANSIKPDTTWFDCRNVARVIQNGSNAAIASSSMTLAMLDGKEVAPD